MLAAVGAVVGCQTANELPVAVEVSNIGRAGGATGATSTVIAARDADGATYRLDPTTTEVRVYERADGGDWREVDDLEPRWDGPSSFDIVVVADNSGSEDGHLADIQGATRSFADAVYAAGERSRLGLVRVSSESSVVQTLTESAIQ